MGKRRGSDGSKLKLCSTVFTAVDKYADFTRHRDPPLSRYSLIPKSPRPTLDTPASPHQSTRSKAADHIGALAFNHAVDPI
jgi:hypothetical protein